MQKDHHIKTTLSKLSHRIKGRLFYDVPLARHTTFGIGGKAYSLLLPKDKDDLIEAVRFFKENRIPFFVLGAGSNVLFLDKGFPGVVIKIMGMLDSLTILKGGNLASEEVLIYAGAGVSLQKLISFSIKNALKGLEFLAGIPGTVGGAIASNAGAFGQEIKDVIDSIEILDNDQIMWIKSAPERFSYRKGPVEKNELILGAIIKVKIGPSQDSRAKIIEYVKWRRDNQPRAKSAGSIFKNPEGVPAGRLIEELGFKGYRIGNAMVSYKHANFIINLGGAKASDVLSIMKAIKERVWEEYKISLEPEIRIVNGKKISI